MISTVLQFELQPQSDEWNPRTRMEKRSGHEDDGQGLAQLVRDDGARFDFFSQMRYGRIG